MKNVLPKYTCTKRKERTGNKGYILWIENGQNIKERERKSVKSGNIEKELTVAHSKHAESKNTG